jgi:FkbM family methyltransferase
MLIDFSSCSKLIELTHNAHPKKVLHIGAHEGEEAAIYKKNGISHCIWFEANTALMEKLKKNTQSFDMEQCLLPYALWNENAVMDFHISNNTQCSSLYEFNTHAQHYPEINFSTIEKIPVYRLDFLINSQPQILPWTDFNFINIDTQGSELPILKGLGKFINAESLHGIYLEINSEHLYSNISLVAEIDEFLAQHNFHRVLTKWWGNQGWGDGFYLKSRTL